MTLADVARAEAENVSAVGGPWEAGWTHLLAYDRGDGQHDLLKVNVETGGVELDRLSEDGWELSTIARNEWNLGGPRSSPFLPIKGRGFLYDARLGTVVLGWLDEALALEQLESGLWERRAPYLSSTTSSFAESVAACHPRARRSSFGRR